MKGQRRPRTPPRTPMGVSAVAVVGAVTAALTSGAPLEIPPSWHLFMAGLKDWLIANDDPRWTGDRITDLARACAEFCEVLAERERPRRPARKRA